MLILMNDHKISAGCEFWSFWQKFDLKRLDLAASISRWDAVEAHPP